MINNYNLETKDNAPLCDTYKPKSMNTIGKNEYKIGKKSTWLQVSTQLISDDWCSFRMWPLWFVAIWVCGHLGLWLSSFWPFRFVTVLVCGRFGMWPFRFVAISVYNPFGFWLFRFLPFRFVAGMIRNRTCLVASMAQCHPPVSNELRCIAASQQTWRNWTRCRQTTRLLQFRWVKFARCGNDVNVTKYVCEYKRQVFICNENIIYVII